ISRDEKKQSAVERGYLRALNVAKEKQTNPKTQNVPAEVVAPIKRKSFRGTVKKIEEGRLTIITDGKKEEIIMLNEKTKTMPNDKKLELDQIVTVSAHIENDQAVADRISIRPEIKASATPIKKDIE
ncbi:MAG: hypothetical protein WA019_03695, partial [Candidatus Moraniibacteriota bacterium]